MNRFKVLFALILTMFFSISIHAEMLDRILAVVNDDVITSADLELSFLPFKMQYESLYKGEELNEHLKKGKTRVLSKMIDELVIVQDASKKELKVSSDEVRQYIAKMRLKFQSEREFLMALKKQSLTMHTLEKRIGKSLLLNKYKQYIVSPAVKIYPVDLVDYYNEHKEEYVESEQVRASQIFISKSENRDEAKLKIDEIAESIKGGVSFESIMKDFGTDLGFFQKGQMAKEIEEVVFSMDVGQISPVIESDLGFHILKITAKKNQRGMSFNAVQDKIRKKVFSKKAEEKYNEIIDDLREEAYIEIK